MTFTSTSPYATNTVQSFLTLIPLTISIFIVSRTLAAGQLECVFLIMCTNDYRCNTYTCNTYAGHKSITFAGGPYNIRTEFRSVT